MIILYSSLIAVTILSLVTLFWIKNKSYNGEPVLAGLSETPTTAMLAYLCLGMSYFMLLVKITNATPSAGKVSYWFFGGFSIVSAVLGCFILLYTYVKKYIILQDKLVAVDMFGNTKNLFWKEIKSAKIPMLTRNIILKGEHQSFFIHSGNPKQYRNFVKVLKDLVPEGAVFNTVNDLYNRL
jgi:hypothetical protein